MAVKSIGKTIESPLFKTIGNTIKKPILKTIGNTVKNSMRILRRNKNTIKNISYGLEEKYLRVRHNFGNRSIKYLGGKGIKNFKSVLP